MLFANNTQQLFTLYECYLEQPYERKDDFFAFSKWAQTLLQDFNEIDRYLVDANELFSNLAAIQEINHWSLQEEKTDLMVDYLKFWDSLDNLYSDFCTKLLHKGMGHQGLVYRKACEAIEGFRIIDMSCMLEADQPCETGIKFDNKGVFETEWASEPDAES